MEGVGNSNIQIYRKWFSREEVDIMWADKKIIVEKERVKEDTVKQRSTPLIKNAEEREKEAERGGRIEAGKKKKRQKEERRKDWKRITSFSSWEEWIGELTDYIYSFFPLLSGLRWCWVGVGGAYRCNTTWMTLLLIISVSVCKGGGGVFLHVTFFTVCLFGPMSFVGLFFIYSNLWQ